MHMITRVSKTVPLENLKMRRLSNCKADDKISSQVDRSVVGLVYLSTEQSHEKTLFL